MASAALQTPRRRNPAETYEAIIAAAKRLVIERGPEALRVSDVAHEASVNRTTAYQHFRTRDELVGAVMARVADEVSSVLTGSPSRQGLIAETIEHIVGHPEIARLWMFQVLSDIPLLNREGWKRFVAGIRELASGGRSQPGTDVEMLSLLVLTSSLSFALLVRSESADETESRAYVRRFTREMTRLLLHGALRPEEFPELDAISHRSETPAADTIPKRATRVNEGKRGRPRTKLPKGERRT